MESILSMVVSFSIGVFLTLMVTINEIGIALNAEKLKTECELHIPRSQQCVMQYVIKEGE